MQQLIGVYFFALKPALRLNQVIKNNIFRLKIAEN